MTERAVPLLGEISLEAVQRLEHELDAGFVALPVAALPGELQQRSERRSHRMRISGLLFGAESHAQLGSLQQAAASGEELVFAADITSALELQRVVITSFWSQQVSGDTDEIAYMIELAESPPLPPPATVDGFGFGGLDEFGVGDLGFDTDVLGDIQDLAGEVAGAVEAAMDVIDELSALADLGSLGDLGGLLDPLSGVTSGAGEAASTFGEGLATLRDVFG